MPVSPQDFDLYSRVTGTPMPSDAMSRMQMAPDVYKFTKDFARKPNLLEKTGNLIKSAGRNTLVGAGLLAGMDLENQERQSQELLRNEIAKDDAVEATMSNPMEEEKETPLTLQIEQEKTARAKLTGEDKIKLKQMEIDAANTSQVASNLIEKTKEKVQEPTTADNYDQRVEENQTEEGILDKKMEQGSEIATEGETIAKVLSESEESKPVVFTNPKDVQKQMESDMVGASPSSKKVAAFFTKLGLDDALAAAGETRDEPVLLIGDDSPLNDHVDVKGKEDDSGVPTQENLEVRGQNTSATTNLNELNRELRKEAARERKEELIDKTVEKPSTPSDRQIKLSEESIRLGSTGGIPNKTDMMEIRKDPEYIAAQESMKPKSATEKTDDYLKQVMEDLNDPDAMMDKPEISYKTSRAGRQEVGLTQGGDYFEVYKNNPQKTYITRLEPIESEAFEAMAGSEINDDKEKRPDASKFLDHFKNLRQQEQL